jgi:hypothetical protein
VTCYTQPCKPCKLTYILHYLSQGDESSPRGRWGICAPALPEVLTVEDVVLGLKSKTPPGPTGTRAEHLKEWLAAARKEVDPDAKFWDSLVELIQYVFEKGEIPTETAWSVLVLIPKGSGGCKGIGLLEIVWKLISSIIDRRLKEKLNFMMLYTGLELLGGTGTATIEAKLAVFSER